MNPIGISHAIRTLLGFLLLTMVMATGGVSVVVAQDAGSSVIRPELFDSVIEIRGEHYVLDRSDLEEYPHGRGERIYISSLESKGFAELSFFDDEDTPDETIAVMLSAFRSSSSSFELLEQGNVENVYYALAHFLMPGYEGYFYIEVAQDVVGNVDVLQNLYSVNSDFSEQLGLVRADVTIGGIPFLQSPVIDVEQRVASDEADRAALAATPVVETLELEDGVVTVESPLTVYDHFTSDVLETVFFTTSSGDANGLLGYLHHEGPTAAEVVHAIASDPPRGERPPQELLVHVVDDDQAVGLYLVTSSEGEILMVLSATRHTDGVWRIESLAAPPDKLSVQYREVVGLVTIEGRPIFETIDIEGLIEDAELAP